LKEKKEKKRENKNYGIKCVGTTARVPSTVAVECQPRKIEKRKTESADTTIGP